MNIFSSMGVVIGILLGIVLVIIIFKAANKDHRMKTEYDERQKTIRGRAYMYAFYTLVVYEVILMVLSMGDFTFPAEDYIVHFTGIIIACMVLACYSIWKGVYWGLNNDRKRYAIAFVILGLINLIPVVGALRNGGMLENGKLTTPFLNLLVLVMMIVIGAELIIKGIMDDRYEEE